MHELAIAESVVSSVMERVSGPVSVVRGFVVELIDEAKACEAREGLELMGNALEPSQVGESPDV